MKDKRVKPFTAEQKRIIKRDYLKKPIKVLAREIDVGPHRISRYLKRNGLVIPKEIIEERKRSTQFVKGHKTHNKGVPLVEWMSPKGVEKVKKAWFKEGRIPPNVNPEGDGAITIRKDPRGVPQKYIRLSIGVWAPYARHKWEKENGKIPDDHILTFKDGDTLNTSYDNLELITKIENILRNSVHNFPEEIIPSMVLIRRIENKLNTLKND